MRIQIATLLAAGFLMTAGCTQNAPPEGGTTTTTTTTTTSSTAPAASPSAAALASPAPSGMASPMMASGAPASGAPAGMESGAPAAMESGAPVAAASGGPGGAVAEGVSKIEEETAMTFTVPATFSGEVKPDGEVQLTSKDIFVALAAGEGDAKEEMDKTISIMKAAGKDSFKQTGDVQQKEENGVKEWAAHGTLNIEGKPGEWLVVVMDNGEKPLRVAAMGKDVLKDQDLEALGNSIKPKK
jgi:hypothetical protein